MRIPQAEFSPEEQGKFLKFATSCSKPPVLGFRTMRPPPTIRAVTDSSREERYTVGSVVANFFRPVRASSLEFVRTVATPR